MTEKDKPTQTTESTRTLGAGACVWPGLAISLMRFAHARPNTTMSSSELAPRRLAPCTDAHAASPAANRPGTTWSGLSPCTDQPDRQEQQQQAHTGVTGMVNSAHDHTTRTPNIATFSGTACQSSPPLQHTATPAHCHANCHASTLPRQHTATPAHCHASTLPLLAPWA